MSRRRYDDRDEVEVEVLETLVERPDAGMTIFELRSRVDLDIETIEPALASLREDGLIMVEYDEDRSVIRPEDRVLPGGERDVAPTNWFERIKRLLFDR